MKDTSIRRIETLRLIPRAPHWVTTSELVARLDRMDHQVSQRTIQRDLIDLSTVFPLDYEVDGRTNRWRWSIKAEVLDLPGMNATTALSFFLAEQYLYEMLPTEATASIEPHFNKAREVLTQTKSKKFDDWIDKVRILSETQALSPPSIKQDVVDTIYTALLENSAFSARYRKRGEKGATQYKTVNPLGLVFRGRVIYLVASLWDYEDPLQFALHRFTSVSILDRPFHKPEGFNLDQYIQSGHFDYLVGERIKIELLLSKGASVHLAETPLSDDQRLSNTRDDRVRLKATVNNTDRLRWWLLGLGSGVEVVKPRSLRQDLIEEIQGMNHLYKGENDE